MQYKIKQSWEGEEWGEPIAECVTLAIAQTTVEALRQEDKINGEGHLFKIVVCLNSEEIDK